MNSNNNSPRKVEFSGPSLGSSLVTGLGLGVGSSIGHNMVNSLFGTRQ